MAHSVAEFRRHLGPKAARYTEAQLRKALAEASESTALHGVLQCGNTVAGESAVIDLPDCRQPNRYSCGAAAAMACGSYFGVGPERISEWESALGTTVERSTHPYAIRDYLRALGLQVEDRQHMTLDDLAAYTARGWPVVTPIQDYGEEREPGAEFAYGHYVAVCGVGMGVVVIQDSALENAAHEPGGDVPRSKGERSGNIAAPGKAVIWQADFLAAWQDKDIEGNKFIRYGIAVGAPMGARNRITKALWDSSKHPRGGDAENPGRFSHGAGTSPYPPPAAPEKHPSFPGAPGAKSPSRDAATRETPHVQRPTPAEYLSAAAKNESSLPPASGASSLHESLQRSKARKAIDLSEGHLNRALLLTLEDGTQGVFKPKAGEANQPRTAWRREIAASQVADLLGLGDLVPATVARAEAGEGVGSMQVYVAGALEAASKAVIEPFDGHEDAMRAAVFDYLLGNVDRHFGNWLLKDGKIVLIDNGAALPDSKEPRYVPQPNFWVRVVKADLQLPDLTGWKGRWGDIEKALRDCGIEDKAVQLTRRRFNALLENRSGRFADLPWMGFESDGSVGSRLKKMYRM